jgi:hypothetical protein
MEVEIQAPAKNVTLFGNDSIWPHQPKQKFAVSSGIIFSSALLFPDNFIACFINTSSSLPI